MKNELDILIAAAQTEGFIATHQARMNVEALYAIAIRERDEWRSGHAHLAHEILKLADRVEEHVAALLTRISN